MQISASVESGSSVTGSGSSAVSANGYSQDLSNEFLTLMVAQIQNQDPLNPTDGTEYINQLAQLSMVESNENLVMLSRANQVMLDNLQVLTTTSLVGTSVDVRSQTIQVGAEGTPVQGKISLEASSTNVALEIRSASGAVKTIQLGAQGAGMVDFEVDVESLDLGPGEYELSVVLDDGQSYQPQIYVTGVIESVNISPKTGEMTLTIPSVGDKPVYEIGRFG